VCFRTNRHWPGIGSRSADRQLALLENRFELYGRALAVSMESDRQRTQEKLDRLEKLAIEAGSTEERLLARWEADLVIARVNQAEVQSWLISMAQKTTEQEKRKASEVEEMAGLKELLTRVGAGGGAHYPHPAPN
jgi:hypothetical protein